MTDTAATLMSISYSVLAFLRRSQFMSRTVLPPEIPRICVCTAPDTPTVQRSELLTLIPGATAVLGGDLTVVSVSPRVVTVLVEVDSVTIGSDAIARDVNIASPAATTRRATNCILSTLRVMYM